MTALPQNPVKKGKGLVLLLECFDEGILKREKGVITYSSFVELRLTVDRVYELHGLADSTG